MRRARKDYFRDLYNMDIQQQVAVPIEGFAGIQRGNYFAGEPNRRSVVCATHQTYTHTHTGNNVIKRNV